jgi:eukaryotic-like serine/threonine-protein kinase
MAFAAGTRLGPYTVTALIGVGGMGEVYKARDTRLGRTIAIKTLSGELASDPELRQRFEREAKAISSLNHPHICTLHDIGSHDGVDFLVMEFLEGETLEQRVGSGALPLEEALRYGVDMADALAAAHERRIVHRDFKPANVTLTPDGVKLLDFGIAKVLAAGTRADSNQALTAVARGTARGAVIGTASYMSPEQARGLPVDRRTDVWAFGCVLFEMLTGKRAFVGATAADTTTAVLGREPNLEELPTATPAAVRHVLRRCLEKDARRRLHDIGDARTELEDALTAMGRAGKGTQESGPSIAVLPFANMSADPDNEYFSDGLAEEILNALTQVPRLKVIARTSAFAFKGKNEDIRRIAETLNVTTVLEGSVRKAGNRIRVTAQLIAAADGSHLWSQRYDRELSDVFAVQDEIAEAITAALRVTIAAPPSAGPPTQSIAAYEAFLKADYYFNKSTFDGFTRSKALLEQAVSLDPRFASAHCALGRVTFILYVAQLIPAHDAVPLIRRHVEDALRFDPLLAEGHAIMGSLAAMYDYDWSEADRRFQLALAHGVVSSDVSYQRTNFFLAHAGRAQEAVEDMSLARAQDPLNPQIGWASAVALRAARRDAEADDLYREVVDMDVGYLSSIAAVVLSGNHLARGAIPESLHFAETAYRRHPQLPWAIGQLAGALARAGQFERSNPLADQLRPGTAFGAPLGLALTAIGAGDLDLAADWLEKAIEQRDMWASFLLNVGNIGGRVMWSSPRWPGLARLMNVPIREQSRSTDTGRLT